MSSQKTGFFYSVFLLMLLMGEEATAVMNLLCGGLVALATTASVVDGHAFQQFPISRQFSRSAHFHNNSYEFLERGPQGYNSGGVGRVRNRSKTETDLDILAKYGGGHDYPLFYGEFAQNGNYAETNEIAKRHKVCGDPRLGLNESIIPYSTPNSEWEVLGAFQSGQEIEIEAVISIYHWGHMELRVCDIGDLDDPDGVVTQECLNTYQLNRAYNEADASPIDPNYPGRYFVDPPCRWTEGEIDWNVADNIWWPSAHDPYTINMRYLLPDIECEHCVMQMHYLTNHICQHIGYEEFNPPSWNSTCAPDKEDWLRTNVSLCHAAYPEEFWSCADISISSSGGTTDVTTEDRSDDDASGICSSIGIDGLDGDGVCCHPDCPRCGGSGCNVDASRAGLTNQDCCRQRIEDSGEYCNKTEAAPCIV